MAPPRKTIEELKSTGNYRPSRQGKRNSVKGEKAGTLKIEVPKRYTGDTKKEFLRVTKYLQREGILTEMDITSLYDAFNVYLENQRIYTELQKLKVTHPDYKDLSTLYSTGVKTFNQIIKQFGAVPSERSKVADLKNKDKSEKKDSLLEALK